MSAQTSQPEGLLPDARWIDPRDQRFGAAVSAVVLIVAWVVAAPWLAMLVGLDLAISPAIGARFFLPGKPWWWVPSRFARLFRRGDHVALSFGGTLARPRS